jgi:hypothetical protein
VRQQPAATARTSARARTATPPHRRRHHTLSVFDAAAAAAAAQDSACSTYSYLSHSYGSYSSSPLGSTPPVFGGSPGGYSPSPRSATALQHMANAAAALYGKSKLGGGRAGSEDKDDGAQEAADMNVDDELAEMADALLLLHESA